MVETEEYREEYLVNENTADGLSQTAGSGECEYYHYNNIGSTMYLTQNGAVTKSYAYGIYGEITKGNPGSSRFLYNGRFGVMTDENNLYYMRARYYNPVIRRFINQDILMGSITNSQSLNRYAYCQGNPVNSMDPFGLSPGEFFNNLGHGILNIAGFVPGIGAIPLVGSFVGSFLIYVVCGVSQTPNYH